MPIRRVKGEVVFAEFCAKPNWVGARKRVQGARRRGVVYESKIQALLLSQYAPAYLPSPWLRYIDDDRRLKYCQPDGLLFLLERGQVTIVEVKYQHTFRGWVQLAELYLPVVQKALSTDDNLWSFGLLEIVKWYDPHVSTGRTPDLCKTPDLVRPGQYGVHICSAK